MSDVVTGKKQKFVEKLLAGADVQQAADAVERTERTGYRWLKEDAVQSALHRGQDAMFDELVTNLFSTAALANGRLRRILMDADVPDYVAVQAAKAALSTLVRLHEYSTLLRRIEALEEEV